MTESTTVLSSQEDLVALYDGSVEAVYRYASRLTGGDRARTDDLVQETYLGVIRRAAAGEPMELSTGYLIAACRSRFLDEIRAGRRRTERELRVVRADPEPAMVELPVESVATARLAELPVDQRVALVLRYVDDLAVAEVARELGRSVQATESLLARGRTALRRLLEGDQ